MKADVCIGPYFVLRQLGWSSTCSLRECRFQSMVITRMNTERPSHAAGVGEALLGCSNFGDRYHGHCGTVDRAPGCHADDVRSKPGQDSLLTKYFHWSKREFGQH